MITIKLWLFIVLIILSAILVGLVIWVAVTLANSPHFDESMFTEEDVKFLEDYEKSYENSQNKN